MGDGDSSAPAPQEISLRIKFMDARETVLTFPADAAIADVAEKVRPPELLEMIVQGKRREGRRDLGRDG